MQHRLFKRIVTGGVLAVLAGVSMGVPAGAQAVPITFEFTGTVTNVDSPLIGGSVAVNDTLMGSYTFEPAIAGVGACGVTGGSCTYSGITDLQFTVGSYTNAGLAGGNITVRDNFFGADNYQVSAVFTGPSINGLPPNIFSINLVDPLQTMLSNTFHPVTPPTLPISRNFAVLFLSRSVGGGVISSGVISGELNSLTPVPEPPTAWLFGLGFGLFALWKVSERHMGQQA